MYVCIYVSMYVQGIASYPHQVVEVFAGSILKMKNKELYIVILLVCMSACKCMYVCMYVCICMFVCKYLCKYLCVSTCRYVVSIQCKYV